MGSLNRTGKNRKAQIEVVALTFLVVGVTAISAFALAGIGNNSRARAEFTRDFLYSANSAEGMELFYSDTVLIAAQNVLEEKGYKMDNFCPLTAIRDSTLKGAIIEKTEGLIGKYSSYKGQDLPHMKTLDGKTGELNLKAVGAGAKSYLQMNGAAAENIEVKTGGVVISSPATFAAKIKQTAENKPDLTVTSVKIKDSAGKEITTIGKGQNITIEAEVANVGCAKVEKETKVSISAAGSNIFDSSLSSFNYGEKKVVTTTYLTAQKGSLEIKATADSASEVEELNEGNNEKAIELTVSEKT